MKQASNQSNQQAPKGNDTPIGAMSVVGILKELADNKNSLTYSFKKDFLPKYNNLNACLINTASLIKNIDTTLTSLYQLALLNSLASNNSVNKTIIGILEQIRDSMVVDKEPKSTKQKISDFGNRLLFKEQINDKLITILDNTNILISTVINNQEITINYLKKIIDNQLKNDNKKSSKKGGKTVIINNDLASTLKALQEFQDNFDKAFVDLFKRFVDIYKEFTDAKLTANFIHIIAKFEAFNIALRIVGIQLSRTKNLFNGLLHSIIILSLALMFPPFTVGFIFLITMIKTLQLSCGGPQGLLLMKQLRGMGLSIIMIAVGASMMAEVKVGNIVKLIFALTAIAGVLRLFDKDKKPTVVPDGKQVINKKSSVKVSGIFSAALGIVMLMWAVSFVRQVDWAGVGALLAFITGLSLVLYIFNQRKYGKKGPLDSLLNISLGITILLLCADAANEVNWEGATKIILFIGAIGLVLSLTSWLGKGKMSGMIGFAFGLSILILCVDAANEVDWDNAWTIIKFIFTVNLAIGLANKLGGKGNKTTGMLGFAFGLALVLLTIDAAKEVNFEPGWQLVKIIATVSLILLFVGDMLKGAGRLLVQISLIAFAITIWSGALWILSKTNIELNQVLLFTLTIGIIVSTFYLISKFALKITEAAGVVTLMIPGIVLMVGATYLISLVNPNWEAFGFFAAVAITSILIITMFGIASVVLGIGSGIMVIAGIALLAFTTSLYLLSNIDVNWESFGFFTAVAGSLIILLTLYAVTSPILVIGSIAMIGVGFAMITVATSLYIISSLDISKEQITIFTDCITLLAIEIAKATIPMILAIVGAGLMIVISVASIVTAAALYIVSELNINVDNIKKFGKGIIKLTEAYDECGIWALTKAVAKSSMLIPISVTTLITAFALRAISALDINENKIDKFGIILGKFITMMCDVVNQHAKDIEKNKEAFEVIATMATAAGSIVNIVEQMANMTVGVWKPDSKTGELKITERRQINDNDFDLISKNMGKVIAALIAPLSIIASDADWWDFGNGTKVPNPFGKSGFFSAGNMSGINRIKAIGDAFEKIPAIMQGFTENPLLTDVSEEGSAKMQKLQENISIFFDTIVLCMEKLPQKSVLDNWFDGTAKWLEDTVQPVFTTSGTILDGLSKTLFWKVANANVAVERVGTFWSTTKLMLGDVEIASKKKFKKSFASNVISFYNELDKLNTNSWLNLTNMDSTIAVANASKILVNTLADSKSFDAINKNLQKTDKNIRSIVGNINKINIQKAGALERNLKLLTQAKSQEALRDAIDQLKIMIGLLKDVQEKQVAATNQQTVQQAQQFDAEQQYKENSKLSEKENRTELLTTLQKLQALLEGNNLNVNVELSGINEEIEQALNNCGLGNGGGSHTGLKKTW